ncbi:MAG: Ezrin/radixin/moesin family protein [Cyclobacteriaceae bacterium]
MKRIAIVLTAAICLIGVVEVNAQMSKAEMKEWKKRIKQLQPEQYKNLLDENKAMKAEAAELEDRAESAEAELDEQEARVKELQTQVQNMRSEVAAAKEQSQKAAAQGNVVGTDGVVFKVQIGAFKNKEELTKFSANNPNFDAESNNDVQKFTIGAFRDYWEADTFKKYLRQMGVKDAWIVSFKDGNRVPIKDVLEGII